MSKTLATLVLADTNLVSDASPVDEATAMADFPEMAMVMVETIWV
jgi:hypothetical protein